MTAFDVPMGVRRLGRGSTRKVVVLLALLALVAMLIAVPLAPPAEAGTSFYCLASIVGVGAAVVSIYAGTAALAASYVGGISSVIGIYGSCLTYNPYWWGAFPYYRYTAGSGGHLNKVKGLET